MGIYINTGNVGFQSARNGESSGKGIADIVLIPRKNVNSLALVLELKFNKDADAAIDQIRRKQYPARLEEYAGNLLLVGVNYDKQSKTHTCRIEHAQT